MEKSNQDGLIQLPDEVIVNQIYLIRNQKVMLDKDLAKLYGVENRILKQAVRRNASRFPSDFMFELSEIEMSELIAQFVIPDLKLYGGAKPFVFTEQGVAMLSSILNSNYAIQVNIQIIRIFTKMRQLLADHTQVHLEIAEIKGILQKQTKRQDNNDKNIEVIFQYLDDLTETNATQKQKSTKIGYKPDWDSHQKKP